MTNDPSAGDQQGWQGQQQGYPGYGQQRGEQPGYGGSYPPPTQQAGGYGQPPPPWSPPAGQQPSAQGASAWQGGSNPQQGGYPAGMGTGLPPAGAQSFTTALFDFGFNSFATPVVIKALYILSLIGIGLFYVFAVIGAFLQDPLTGLVTLVVGGILALLSLIYTRVILELLFAVVRIAEDVRVMRDRQP